MMSVSDNWVPFDNRSDRIEWDMPSYIQFVMTA